MRTRGHASSLGWGKVIQERDKFVICGNLWEVCVAETRVWSDVEDCSWGSVLVLTGS